ncbi:hypothetical protein AVEN_134304-1 [Araneus ventricosus]|uniref:Uncharacterized protein n=1 Tax=Araneus ventricosus TaxID=182803 RepID=A0A4Y2DR92_ARAVE|nr:hypothetical protein AVEN_91457-1 [Araneus ventricosus]GBM18775.1 hypothetical protein AVEN_134304-1 [Araneus ventricosus]
MPFLRSKDKQTNEPRPDETCCQLRYGRRLLFTDNAAIQGKKLLSYWLNHKSNPVLPRHPGTLNDSRCSSPSTEAGVLIANHLATARPLPKEVRTITGGRQHMSNHFLYTQGRRVPASLSGSNSSVYLRCIPGESLIG